MWSLHLVGSLTIVAALIVVPLLVLHDAVLLAGTGMPAIMALGWFGYTVTDARLEAFPGRPRIFFGPTAIEYRRQYFGSEPLRPSLKRFEKVPWAKVDSVYFVALHGERALAVDVNTPGRFVPHFHLFRNSTPRLEFIRDRGGATTEIILSLDVIQKSPSEVRRIAASYAGDKYRADTWADPVKLK